MKRVVLHIGQPKTGSTSIQWYLCNNSETLRTLGVYYPTTDICRRNHNMVLPPLDPDAELPIMIERRVANNFTHAKIAVDKEWNTIVNQCKQSGAETVVLSAERMFDLSSDETSKRLFEKVQQISTNIDVAAYIRSPVPLYVSAIQEWVKRRSELRKLKPRDIRLPLEKFGKSTGGEITLRPFDKKRLIGGDIVKDFIHSNISQEFANNMEGKIESRNESMSAEAMAVQQEFNRFCLACLERNDWRTHVKLSRIIHSIDQEIEGHRKPVVRPEVADHLVRISHDYNWLREKYSVEFDDIDYALIGKPTRIDPKDYSDIDQICVVDQERAAEMKIRFMKRLSERSTAQKKGPFSAVLNKLKHRIMNTVAV